MDFLLPATQCTPQKRRRQTGWLARGVHGTEGRGIGVLSLQRSTLGKRFPSCGCRRVSDVHHKKLTKALLHHKNAQNWKEKAGKEDSGHES
jgi:hypothetical protein